LHHASSSTPSGDGKPEPTQTGHDGGGSSLAPPVATDNPDDCFVTRFLYEVEDSIGREPFVALEEGVRLHWLSNRLKSEVPIGDEELSLKQEAFL
jgi:hypothetical protein